RHRTRGGVRAYSAAALTIGAAFIHLAVAPEHLREFLPFGMFFLAVGSAQIVLAVELVARPTRRLAMLMSVLNIRPMVLWYVSRTSGLSVGPEAGTPEDVGLSDVLCNLLEVFGLVLLLSLAVWPARCSVRRLLLVGAASAPTSVASAIMTFVAVSATL